MPSIDTHVLVRWLTNDDAAQCALIEQLLQSTAAAAQRLSVPITVVWKPSGCCARATALIERPCSPLSMPCSACQNLR